MLRNSIRAFSRNASKRISRSEVDDNSAANVMCSIPAPPCLRVLLPHSPSFCTHTDQVTPGIDVHDTVEILDIGIGNGCVDTIVDL